MLTENITLRVLSETLSLDPVIQITVGSLSMQDSHQIAFRHIFQQYRDNLKEDE